MSADQQPLPAVSHDGWLMALPAGWAAVEPDMFEIALAQTQAAFTGGGVGVEHAVEHLRPYYDPAGRYAGATFLDVEGDDDSAVTAADLWAVTTLSMTVPPDAGRALLYPGALRNEVNKGLRHLPPTLPLSDAAPEHLDHMWDLYSAVKTMLPALGKRDTNQWVMASKLCARKRPLLFPVRDSQVCRYLANTHLMGNKPGRLGSFGRDTQVFAYLSTHQAVRGWIRDARDQVLVEHPDWAIDWTDLRLLDIVLWMEAART